MDILDWSKLEAAYGSAANVPSLLASARTAPAPETEESDPWFGLWQSLFHQGDVYTASYAAVPELVEIAANRTDDGGAECLFLAAMIELRRHEYEAPAIPPVLRPTYEAAVRAASSLAESESSRIAGKPDGETFRLRFAAAVFGGDVVRARRLLDGDEP
jgi:hypothetical protein